MPTVGVQLLQLTRDPDVQFDAVLKLLEQDAMVAGRLLKIAQSPVYSAGTTINSLHQALVRLGLSTLRDVFFEAVTRMRVFRAPGYQEPMERLRKHSTATAYVARVVCRFTALSDEYAFLCGLLHDVGIAASMIALCEGRDRANPPPPFEKVWPAVRAAHERASEKLAELWMLPADVQMVLGNHHSAVIGGRFHPLAAVISTSDFIASQLGFGFEDEINPLQAQAARESLNLSNEVLRLMRKKAEQALADFDQSPVPPPTGSS